MNTDNCNKVDHQPRRKIGTTRLGGTFIDTGNPVEVIYDLAICW